MKRWVLLAAALMSCGASQGSIGAVLGKRHADGRVVVHDVPGGMEGAKAGLIAGDEILTIDGRDARRMTAQEVHEALVGPIGSTVDLTILRDGEVLRLQVRRGPLR
jgi:carboxyl-terminal processing protease